MRCRDAIIEGSPQLTSGYHRKQAFKLAAMRGQVGAVPVFP
jgi:hypothetical protein